MEIFPAPNPLVGKNSNKSLHHFRMMPTRIDSGLPPSLPLQGRAARSIQVVVPQFHAEVRHWGQEDHEQQSPAQTVVLLFLDRKIF